MISAFLTIFIFVLILICLFGCEEKKEIADFSLKNDLEFELLNDEINFIQVNPEQLKSEIVVYSDEQREKALNRIDFKITMLRNYHFFSSKRFVIKINRLLFPKKGNKRCFAITVFGYFLLFSLWMSAIKFFGSISTLFIGFFVSKV